VRNLLLTTILAGIILQATCRTAPPVEPSGAESSAIAIQIEFGGSFFLLGNGAPDRVYFVRLAGDDLMSKSGFLPGTWCRENRCYLLNAEAGSYAVVAARYLHTTGSHTYGFDRADPMFGYGEQTRSEIVVFPRALIERTRIRVAPGQGVFIGRYIVEMIDDFSAADSLQKHYAELFVPGSTTRGQSAQSYEYTYCSRLLAGFSREEALLSFQSGAREDFTGSKWLAYFQGE